MVAAPVLLMVYNWPEGTDRYIRLAKFVDALFSKIDEFHEPSRHPKWRDTNLTAPVPGWQRFKPAEEWLARHKQIAPHPQAQGSILARQEAGRTAPVNLREQERLFQEFLEWSKKH
jgi:hypothetical protein